MSCFLTFHFDLQFEIQYFLLIMNFGSQILQLGLLLFQRYLKSPNSASKSAHLFLILLARFHCLISAQNKDFHLILFQNLVKPKSLTVAQDSFQNQHLSEG